MKHVPIALLIFVAPAFAEELPVNPAVTQATIGRTICKPDWTDGSPASSLTLPLQTQPDWKQQFGAKKEVWDGEEALFA
jgi:hypothetical protein